jgi:hypothetical protein
MTTDSTAKPGFLGQLFAAPPRLAALLPDGRFFLRLVPVDPESDAASAAEQVALALESLAPFPLAQLYYGHYWQPGSPRALVYAVYRKRFSAEESAAWGEAEIVVPAFVSLLIDPAEPGVTRVLTSPDAVTLFHWGEDAFVPSLALIQPLAPDTDEAGRTAARDQLIRSAGANAATVEDWDYPVLHRVRDSGEVTFHSGQRPLVIPGDLAAALDVRDAEEIAWRRGIQRRDIWLWRGFAALATLVLLCGVAEGALRYGLAQQRKLAIQISNDRPKVTNLENTETNTTNAERAFDRRLPALEMINFVMSVLREAGRDRAYQFTSFVPAINTKENTTTLTLNGNASSLQDALAVLQLLQSQTQQVSLAEWTQQPSANTRGGATGDPAAPPVYQFGLRVTFRPNTIQSEGVAAPVAPVAVAPSGA